MDGGHVWGYERTQAVIKPIRDLITRIHFPIHFQVTNVGVIFRFESPDGSKQGGRRILLQKCVHLLISSNVIKDLCLPDGVPVHGPCLGESLLCLDQNTWVRACKGCQFDKLFVRNKEVSPSRTDIWIVTWFGLHLGS